MYYIFFIYMKNMSFSVYVGKQSTLKFFGGHQ